MESKVSDLTVAELKEIIDKSVKEAIEDYLEDLDTLSSSKYIDSIKEARADYKAGRVTRVEDLKND